MAETMILRNSAINRNFASQSAPATPAEGQAGPMPIVKVHMTGNGPQLLGGQTVNPVRLTPAKDAKRVVHSGLPMVQVKMGTTGPSVQVPQVGRAASAAPRAVPQQIGQVAQVAPEPDLSNDQLLFCRHVVDKYLADLRATPSETLPEGAADNAQIAEATIAAIDAKMVARTTAEAEAILAAEAPPPVATAGTHMRPPRVVVSSRSGMNNAAVTPRRVARPAAPSTGPRAPLPIVDVKMQGGQAVVKEQPADIAAFDPSAAPEQTGDGSAQ